MSCMSTKEIDRFLEPLDRDRVILGPCLRVKDLAFSSLEQPIGFIPIHIVIRKFEDRYHQAVSH